MKYRFCFLLWGLAFILGGTQVCPVFARTFTCSAASLIVNDDVGNHQTEITV